MLRPIPLSLGVVAGFFFTAGIIFWGGFNTVLEATNTETFCISCHAMEDNIYPEYEGTIHHQNRSGVRATCPDCHVPHKWTDKIVRKIQASRDVWGTITGTIDTPEKFEKMRLHMASREWKRFKENDSLECRNCHDQEFMDPTQQGAAGAFMHTEMLPTDDFTCIDCHKGIAHQLPSTPGLDGLSPFALEPVYRPEDLLKKGS
ncbi:MAG: NapC/NirT family cytochrome c [Halopseudomonas sp.]